MEDVVALVATDTAKGKYGFMTWGRVFDAVDDTELMNAIRSHLHTFGLTNVEEVKLCESLIESSHCKYFYEGLFAFANRSIPFGDEYANWACDKRDAILSGREIFCAGALP